MSNLEEVDVSVIIPAYKRVTVLLSTLDKIRGCVPRPKEVLVYIDGGIRETYEAVKKHDPSVKIILGKENIGPGGGRNILLKSASFPIVASFDDDSYPKHSNFFSKLLDSFNSYPTASLIAFEITEKNADAPMFRSDVAVWTSFFCGCGCAYRKQDFLKLPGYVPLPNAYGCEEADLALQILHLGKNILFNPELKVFHDTEMEHHSSSRINAASIRNLGLLAYLRYPMRFWILGLLQVLNRFVYLIKMQRFKGILQGFLSIPLVCWKYRHLKNRVSSEAVKKYRQLLSNPQKVING